MASTALLASGVAAQAQQAWTGAADTNWFNAGNWNPNGVPGIGDQPTIDTTAPNPAIVDGAAAGGPATASLSQIFIGSSGTGTLRIQNGGKLTTDNAFVGNNAGANGTVTVTGAASAWTSTNASNGTIVGYDGTGTFNVLAGGTVNTVNTILGFGAASSGTATVDGAGSTWKQTGAAPLSALFVGYGGTGSFTVQNGGGVTAVDTYVGHLAGSNGTATVTGVGSTWTTSGSIFVGNGGTGTFNVLSGGIVTSSSDVFLGYSAGSTGTLNVDGAGSKFTLATGKTFFVGGSGFSGVTSGTGIVNVTNGGTLDMNGTVTLLGVSGGTGTINFDASTWNPGSAVAVGFSGTGTVNIANGSVATLNGQIIVGDSSTSKGTVAVSGAGSQFNSIALLDVTIGQSGTGTFTVDNGASASFLGGLVIGADAGSSGTVSVQNGSTFTTDRGDITIGKNGSGTFNVLGDSTFLATVGTGPSANAFVGYAAGATGTLNVSGAGSSWLLPNGILFVGGNDYSGGTAGTGIVNVTGGATLAPSSTVLGSSGGTGTTNVDGSTFNTGNLLVGYDGTGTVNITGGSVATISLGVVDLGDCGCANGTVTVSGAGSQFISTTGNSGDITIGVDGNGTFNVRNGATATFATDVILGFGNGSGTVNVESGGTFTTPGALVVGLNGLGTVNVTGAGSALNATDIYVGESGTGTVNVTNGGAVNLTGTTFLADCLCAVGTVTVSGAGSIWNSPLGSAIGIFGTGQFNVLDGATANLGPVLLGTGPGQGTLQIDATSQATATGGPFGAYTQGPNGTFNVGISPAGNGKLTATGGDINLDGALVVNAKTTRAMTYTIMTTDGTVVGTFGSVSVVGNANNPQVLYNVSCGGGCSAVQLSVDTFSLANLLPSGLTGNPKHVADAIDGAINAGVNIPDPFFNIFALTGNDLVKALSQLSGEPAAGANQSSIQLMNSFLSLLLNPYGGAPNDNPGAIGFAREFGAAAGNISPQISPQAAAAYAAVTPKDKRPESFAARWSVWAQAYGGVNKNNGNAPDGSHDSTARTYGFATGFDYRVAADTMVGFALAGAGESWGLSDALGGGHADALQLGLYGSRRFGAAYISGALSYAVHDVSTNRTVTVAGSDQLGADFTAHSVGGRLEAGYRLSTPYGGVAPYAAVQVQGFFTPAYAEHAIAGAGTFALSFSSRASAATRTELGAWYDRTVALAHGDVLALRLRAAWANDHSSNQGISAAFQTLPGAAFTVNGAAPANNLALLTFGAEYRLTNNVSFGARLDGEFSGSSQTYAGTATVRYVW
jgi:T5SS/PEP-CTERM-associated repeat protein